MSDSRKSVSGKYPLSDEADPPPNYVDGADNLVKPQRRPDQQQPRLLVPNSPFIHMSPAQRQDQQQAQQLQLSQGPIERGQEIKHDDLPIHCSLANSRDASPFSVC